MNLEETHAGFSLLSLICMLSLPSNKLATSIGPIYMHQCYT